MLNRAGTTFRGLPDADKTPLDADKAIALMLAQPSMIKRPVLEGDGKLLIGFKPDIYAAALLILGQQRHQAASGRAPVVRRGGGAG